jgi:hypothetical protein
MIDFGNNEPDPRLVEDGSYLGLSGERVLKVTEYIC